LSGGGVPGAGCVHALVVTDVLALDEASPDLLTAWTVIE